MSTLHISLPRDAASPAEARRQVGRFVTESRFAQAEVVVLITSELVTNAVTHGAEPIEVHVVIEAGLVRIEVRDSDPDFERVARRRHGFEEPPGGRGLHIVDRLTSRWGAHRHDDGKTVWAEVGSSPPSNAPA